MSGEIHKIADPFPPFCVICGRNNYRLILKIEHNNEIWNTVRFCSMRCFKKIKIPFEHISKNKYTMIDGFCYAIREIKVDDERIKWWLKGTAETVSLEEFQKMSNKDDYVQYSY